MARKEEKVINNIISEKIKRFRPGVPKLNSETTFEEIGFDSLDIMEVILEAEGILKKGVPNNEINKILSLGDLCELFSKKNDR